MTRYIMTRAQSAPRVTSPSSLAEVTPMVVCTTRYLSTFNRCQHNTTIFRTASSVTIADVSWRISSAVHRGTSSAASASKYVDIYTMRTSFIDNQFKMATVNIFQLYQKTCSVCQCAITKDCVEGNGKFYHSNCIKVSTDYRDSN